MAAAGREDSRDRNRAVRQYRLRPLQITACTCDLLRRFHTPLTLVLVLTSAIEENND